MQDKMGKHGAVTGAGRSMKMTDRLSSRAETPASTQKRSVNSKLLMWDCDGVKWDRSRPLRKQGVTVWTALVASWWDHYPACLWLVWINHYVIHLSPVELISPLFSRFKMHFQTGSSAFSDLNYYFTCMDVIKYKNGKTFDQKYWYF